MSNLHEPTETSVPDGADASDNCRDVSARLSAAGVADDDGHLVRQISGLATAARQESARMKNTTRLFNQITADPSVWSSLCGLFSHIAADVLDHNHQAAVLDVLADTPVGECCDVHRAWKAFLQQRSEEEDRQKLAKMAEKDYVTGTFRRQIATSLRDVQGPPPALWGRDMEVLWPAGEPLLVAAGISAGKTTLAGLLVRAMLFGGEVLGYPVRQLADDQSILYLALDRPEQIRRSLARQFTTKEQHATFEERVTLWRWSLPADAAEKPGVLRDLADFYGAHVVIVDSLKDAAKGLAEDRVAAEYNHGRKLLLETGRELIELHHLTGSGSKAFGSVWIPAGAGSVILLSGKPGGAAGTVKQDKPPAHTIGPLAVTHDRDHGEIMLRPTGNVSRAAKDANADPSADADLVKWVLGKGAEGVAAMETAQFLYGSTERKCVERARRALNNARDLVSRSTSGGRGAQARWVHEGCVSE